MLEWVLDTLPADVRRIVVAVNWKAQALGAYLAQREAKGRGRRIEFVVVREEEPLGTAGAIKNCQAHLSSDRMLVLNADIVSSMDIAALANAHKAHQATATISLKEVPAADVVHYGVVKPAGPAASDGAIPVADFVEKPKDPAHAPSRFINAGACILERSVLDLIPAGKLVSLEKDIFPQLLSRGFWGLPFDGHWIDVGDPARLLQASQVLDASFKAGAGTRIAPGARFEQSVAGRDGSIRSGAVVENSILGDGVTVDVGVQLSNCVVGDGEFVRTSVAGQRIWTKPIPAGYPDKQVGNRIGA